jgi:dihydrofolate reductase
MRISLILAMDENRGIGLNNKLPWRLPDDLKRFKIMTMGHHIIMGRKTFESIGRPLPGRTNIIITRRQNYHIQGCLIAASPKQALTIAARRNETEAFIIGGAEIFSQTLPLSDRIYLTIVHARLSTDVFFPELDSSEWIEIQSTYQPSDEDNVYATTFKILEKNMV